MNPYILGGGGAIIAILGLLLYNSVQRTGELEAKLATQAQETQECADANETNNQTVTELEARIDALSALRRAEADERERILTERDETMARARALADELERVRDDEIETNEDCAALTGLRVDAFCPAIADQLRQRSRGPGGNGDTDG